MRRAQALRIDTSEACYRMFGNTDLEAVRRADDRPVVIAAIVAMPAPVLPGGPLHQELV